MPHFWPFPLSEQLAVDTPPEERTAIFEEAWRVGGLQFRSSFFDLMHQDFATLKADHIESEPDPDVRAEWTVG